MGSSLRASHEEEINNLGLANSNSNNNPMSNVVSRVIFTTFSVLILLTILSTLALMSTHVSADPISTTSSATASVNVSAACTMSASIATGEEHTKTINAGTFTGDIGLTTISTICNDNGGYAIYAIGYSNDSYVDTDLGRHTDLIYSNSTAGATTNNIATGTAQTGNTSSWSMKLAAIGTAAQATTPTIAGSASDPHKQTGDTDYSNYAAVPTTYTKVAYLPNSTMDPDDPTTSSTTSSLTTTYGVYAHPAQAAGTYNGKVRYTLVHPSTQQANLNLYDTVARMSKGKQSPDDLRAVITEDNSGVYEYDPDTYGVASDASNTYPIYYYRGILDETYVDSDELGSVGSSGDGELYPNYVRLGNNTCWRIVRTTGSGGVKMIYNGLWNSTDGTCANSWNSASIGAASYNKGNPATVGDDDYGTLGFVVYVGYNYSNAYAYNHTEHTELVNNSLLFGNEVSSNARAKTENWYANNMTNYTNKLESGAGWCNDRTTSANPSIDDTTTPYSLSPSGGFMFGSGYRNIEIGGTLSLTCPNITGSDLLTVSNGLGYPIALLTEDELALIGSGVGGYFHPDPTTVTDRSSNYSFDSYIGSGNSFWSLSPLRRDTDGKVVNFAIYGGRFSGNYRISGSHDIRPAISLIHSTSIISGSGTAEDPWLIAE